MRALIIYANPEPGSFTAALRDTAVQTLQTCGYEVVISDLYAEEFNPAAGRHDFTTVADPARFHYQTEQAHASACNGFAADITREQERVQDADLLLWIFPLWWGGVPAIMKGWFDRVLAYGFAYQDGMRYDTGFFRNRVGLLGVVTGGTARRFSETGAYGSIEQVLWPTQHCMIEYLGLTTPEPYVAYAAPRVSAEARQDYLTDWRTTVQETAKLAEELSSRPATYGAKAQHGQTSWNTSETA